MRRRLNRIRTRDLLGYEAKGLLKLGPWVISSLVLLVLLLQLGLPTTMGLFQSPVTPEPETPTSVPTQTPSPTLEPAVPTATQVPTGMPTESITVTVEPPATLLPTSTPITPTFTPTPIEATPTPTATILPSSTPEPTATVPAGEDRYPDEESNLRFEWSMLVDSAALALSYTWLCCGALIVLAIPALFAVLWVASNRREQAED